MDFKQTVDGDIFVNGLDMPKQNIADFLYQRIINLLRSKPGDWEQYPAVGIDITRYVGYPNIPSTADLVESEVLESLQADSILGNFDIEVIYTPTASDSAIIEIILTLPDGDKIEHRQPLRTSGNIIGYTEDEFTPAAYDTESQTLITEIVNVEITRSDITLKHRPSNEAVYIVPYDDDLEPDENGRFTFVSDIVTQNIEMVSTDPGSGEQGVDWQLLGNRTYTLESEIQTILNENMVVAIEVFNNDEIIPADEFTVTNRTFTLQDTVSGTVEFNVEYFDTIGISNIVELKQNSAPNKIFPRSRTSAAYKVLLTQTIEPGQYYVQYSTYSLEGYNA